MGYGDEIIASGQARVLHAANQRKVFIYDRNGAIREHEMWRGNPRIGTRSERPYQPQMLTNGPGVRPYIASKSAQRWAWREWECPAGEIYFVPDELGYAAAVAPSEPFVLIEPNNKQKASPNKDWGLERWSALAGLMRRAGIQPWQLGAPGTRLIPGARLIFTPGFRLACAVLARAKACVLPEGGLHHAAAALGIPAVVIFGGFISPKQTGYAAHVNLFTGGEPCGMRVPCGHCALAMGQIQPAAVLEELQKLLVIPVRAM